MRTTLTLAAIALLACTSAATAKPAELTVTLGDWAPGAAIPETHALCAPTKDGKSDKQERHLRPAIRWSAVPEGTASIAVFMMDPDVPADFTDAGKDGKILKNDMKRRDFFHWALVDIPATTTELAESDAAAPAIGTPLMNDLGAAGYVSPSSAYGGPCPPWNDERIHHYHFIVLALDKNAPIAALDREQPTAKATFDRLMASPNVLAHGTAIGTYTLNKNLRKK